MTDQEKRAREAVRRARRNLSDFLLSRDNLDENGGGNQSLKRRPVAKV
jgi:hypothetical protein